MGMRQHLGTGGRNHLLIAAGVVAVLVGVEDLPDGPSLRLGGGQAFLMIEGVNR